MRILESWLKKYIAFSIEPQVLADRLTMMGLEFEKVERLDEPYNGFVVGEVLSCEKHPNADKLTVCRVSTGKETLQIVCGAPNVAPGQKVALGLVGATVPRDQHGGGAPFVLSGVTIRGVESFGMICSEFELNMGSDAQTILVLDTDAKAGQSLGAYFGLDDVAFDLEITPNRPDWLSHIGVAREIGVLTGKPPRLPDVHLKESKEKASQSFSVTVEDAENCPRFAARVVKGVHIGPSPRWLQNAMRNVGLRPRNNIVDITNFVMYECGQPMHAFDLALLRRGRIVVRSAREGTPFTTLDGKQHTLSAGTVMVCDGEREVSVAGIMGGANSEISDETVDIVLEAAYWNPSSIRRSARALGISTDASQRFERGADPNAIPFALNRAAALAQELAGGTVLKGLIDVYPKKIRDRIVPLRRAKVNGLLGTSLKESEIARYLSKIAIPKAPGKTLRFQIPTFRVDIDREVDLIEEVARVHGYDKIEQRPNARIDFSSYVPDDSTEDAVRQTLIGRGFQEAITNSMQKESVSSLGGAVPVTIRNPQNQDMATLRTSLLAGLLETVSRNHNLGNFDLRLFEIGHVFRLDNTPAPKLVENFLEEKRVCVVLTGSRSPLHWSGAREEYDIFDIKGELEDLVAKFALDKSRFISYSTSNGLTDNTLTVEIQGSYAGYLGQVSKDLLKHFALERPVFTAELSLAELKSVGVKPYAAVGRFPTVRRDVAFTVDSAVRAEEILKTIRASAGELLQSVELFDVYEGEQLPAGKKSVAFTLSLMSWEKTLTDAEIDSAIRGVVQAVEKSHGAALRSMR